jgi:hypothetical protein
MGALVCEQKTFISDFPHVCVIGLLIDGVEYLNLFEMVLSRNGIIERIGRK